MAESDREHCLAELKRHETEVSMLSVALAELGGGARDRHSAYLTAQVIRHRISMALLESRLGNESARPQPE